MPKLSFFSFRQMTVPNGLIAFCPLCGGSFLGTHRILKSFKLPLLAPRFRVRIARTVKIERHIFPWEMNCHPAVCYTYKAGATEHISSHHFSLLPSYLSYYFQSFPATSLPFYAPWPRDLLTILPSPTHRPMRTLGEILGRKASLQRLILQPVAPP
jgi:hypothetical protein